MSLSLADPEDNDADDDEGGELCNSTFGDFIGDSCAGSVNLGNESFCCFSFPSSPEGAFLDLTGFGVTKFSPLIIISIIVLWICQGETHGICVHGSSPGVCSSQECWRQAVSCSTGSS